MNINFKVLDDLYFMNINEFNELCFINDDGRVYLGIITTKLFDDIINELWSMWFYIKRSDV